MDESKILKIWNFWQNIDDKNFESNTAMIRNYISPVLGSMKLNEITPRVLEKYYMQLLTNPETAGLLKALVNAMGNEESK